LGDNYGKPPWPTFDVRNNVMYNWGGICSGMTGDELSANYVANYLRPGPNSSQRAPIVLTKTASVKYFLEGNVVEGRPEFTGNPAAMFTPAEEGGRKLFTLVQRPFDVPPVKTASAEEAFRAVITWAGAICPMRDAVDERIVREVQTRTGRIINSQKDVGGWPVYRQGPAAKDTDDDGIPDDWEIAHRLNPRDPKDAALDRDGDGYTNIEEYLGGLVQACLRKNRQ
jgi:hypothetical protein